MLTDSRWVGVPWEHLSFPAAFCPQWLLLIFAHDHEASAPLPGLFGVFSVWSVVSDPSQLRWLRFQQMARRDQACCLLLTLGAIC